jgi:hypothetical protein
MRHDQNMIAKLRAEVIEVLEAAGYRNSEDNLPTYVSGGTFSAIGGDAGVTVTCDRWDATEAELGELRAGIAAALQAAELEVHETSNRLYVLGT